jgi:hypothetical protein
MQVKRFNEIKGYDAPNHRACSTLRVFGAEAGGTQSLIVDVSHFLAGSQPDIITTRYFRRSRAQSVTAISA